MVFKRRKQLSWVRQAREAVYPTSGWRRAVNYIGHRLKRLPDTPHRIALGIACGVFVSFSPVFGLHFLYAALLAMMLRANILAALLGTFLGNPLTFPFMAAVSYRLGRQLLGMPSDPHVVIGLKDKILRGVSGLWDSLLSFVGLGKPRWGDVASFFTDVFWPYFVGGIIPGLVTGLIVYLVSRPLVAAYQSRRRLKLERIAEAHRLRARAPDPAE